MCAFSEQEDCGIICHMEEHYNAFISYRHMPRDIRVAEELQRQLERFPIPADLQKKYGIRRIDRIFRDKEELQASFNLSDNIQNALNHSDWLIVVCSPDTKASRWIDKEIRLFLETHDHDRILTVLADGDPYEVIPDALLQRTILTEDENGSQKETIEKLEPLSCDYRMDFRKARKKELPRLLSVIIGCSYDELMRRRQQYLMKRYALFAAAVLTVLAGFIAYLLWSNHQIQKNYLRAEENLRQSQINQSRFLSESALDALEDHDRIRAVELALEAMPKEEGERPLVAEAEYALSAALGIYKTGGPLDFTAVQQYLTAAEAEDILVSQTHNALAAKDKNGTVYLWNPEDGSLRLKKSFGSSCVIRDAGDTGFFILSPYNLSLYDWTEGKELFSRTLAVFPENFFFDPEQGVGTICDGRILLIDDHGKELQSIPVSKLAEETDAYCRTARYRADLHLLAASVSQNREHRVVLYDTESGKRTSLPKTFRYIDEILILDDGTAVIADFETDDNFTYAEKNAVNYYVMREGLSAFDSKTGKERWHISLPFKENGDHQIEKYTGEDGKEKIVVSLSETQAVIDPSEGKISHECQWTSPVLKVFTFSDISGISSVLENGCITTFLPEGDSAGFRMETFPSDLSCIGRIRNSDGKANYYAVRKGENRVIRFFAPESSPAYSSLFALNGFQPQISTWLGDILAVYGFQNGRPCLMVYDLAKDQERFQKEIRAGLISTLEILSDQRLAVLSSSGDIKNPGILVSLEDGSEEPIAIDEITGLILEKRMGLLEDSLAYLYTDYGRDTIFAGSLNLVSGEDRRIEQPVDSASAVNLQEAVPLKNPDAALFSWQEASSLTKEHILLADFNTQSTKELPVSCLDHKLSATSCDRCFAIRAEEGIAVFDYEGKLLHTIDIPIASAVSMAFHENDLFVLHTDGTIVRYDSAFMPVQTYQGDPELNITAASVISWLFENNQLILACNDTLQIFDLSQQHASLSAERTVAYDLAQNRILIRKSEDYYGDNEIGALKIYSPEDLVKYGREVLGEDPVLEEASAAGF